MNRPVAAVFLALFAGSFAFAQDISGVWEGTALSTGTPAPRPERVIVNISRKEPGALTGMIYGTEQAGPTYPFLSITFVDSTLNFVVNRNGVVSFTGRMEPGGNAIDGWYGSQRLHLVRSHPLPPPKANETPLPTARDATELLKATVEKIAAMTSQLKKYTCLESIDRAIYVTPPAKIKKNIMTQEAASCAGIRSGHTDNLLREATDRLRLQVAVADNTEIHSWPNAAEIGSRTVFQMVTTGPISTGSFGLYLVDVFLNPATVFHFLGRGVTKDASGEREIFAYTFQVPFQSSHMQIRAGNGWVVAGYSGSFDINAATAELASLRLETDELPPVTNMCRAATAIDYHMVLIGEGELLLPLRSQLDTINAKRDESVAVTTFSACHEYSAESSIRFDGDASSPGDASPSAPAPLVLPPGLEITLDLLEPIVHNAAAGDVVEARVRDGVRDPQSHRVLIPAGATASGRITLMRHRYLPFSSYEVSMTFNKVDIGGTASPLSLRVARRNEKPRRENGLLPSRQEFSLPPDAGESDVTVVFGSGAYAVPARWESKWITR